MQKGRLILWGIVGFLIIHYWRIYNATKLFVYGMGSVRNFSLKSGALSFTLGVTVENLARVSVPVTSVAFRNIIGNMEVGTSVLESATVIRAGSITELPIRVRIPYLSLITVVLGLRDMLRGGLLKMSLSGYIHAVGITVPYNQDLQVPIPKVNI